VRGRIEEPAGRQYIKEWKVNKSWYAVYVRARHERKVMDALRRKEVECYLPVRKETRQWSDRKKEVVEPLIRGYLFVHIDIRFYYDVMVTPGVISFVQFDQKPTIIPEFQIEDLKIFLRGGGQQVEVTSEHIRKGQMVLISDGPFKDVIGEVTELRGKKRILIRIRALGCTVHAQLDTDKIEQLDAEKEAQRRPRAAG